MRWARIFGPVFPVPYRRVAWSTPLAGAYHHEEVHVVLSSTGRGTVLSVAFGWTVVINYACNPCLCHSWPILLITSSFSWTPPSHILGYRWTDLWDTCTLTCVVPAPYVLHGPAIHDEPYSRVDETLQRSRGCKIQPNCQCSFCLHGNTMAYSTPRCKNMVDLQRSRPHIITHCSERNLLP